MYGGGGHVLDAINRLKGNRSQLANSRRRRDRLKGRYYELLKTSGFESYNEKIPKEVQEKIKAEIRAELRHRYFIQALISWLLFFLLLAWLIWMFIS